MPPSPLRRLLAAYRANRRTVATAITGALMAAGMSAIIPLVIRALIDEGVRARRPGLLLPLGALLVAAAAVRATGFSLRRRFSGEATVHTEVALRSRLYEHLQALDVSYHERTPAGQLMSRATSDLVLVRELLVKVPITVGTLVQIAAVAVLMSRLDPALAGLALAPLPLLAAGTPRLLRRLGPAAFRTQQEVAELTAVAEETVTGIRVVKAFGRETDQTERLRARAAGVFDHARRVIRLRADLTFLFEIVPALGLAAVAWVGGHRVIDGHLTFGSFVAFSVYVTQLTWPVRLFGTIVGDAQEAAAAAGRIYEVLDTDPGIADRPDARPLAVDRGSVAFARVGYRGDDGRLVLSEIDLEVPGGTSLALVGPTGCGKTTLLRLLLRFIEPKEGRVLVDGTDVSTATLASLRSRIATVFEETTLFSDTVAANIAFGRPGATDDEILRAAALAQAHRFVTELPHGYETVVGEQGYTLSGGQRQRLAVARAILMDPAILLLDDATSAVDPEVESEIRRGLAHAMEGRTTLVVARRMATAALADRVAYLEAGRIVAQGSHRELWAAVPAYREALSGAAAAAVGS